MPKQLSPWRTALSTLVLSAHGHHGGSKRSAAIGAILLVLLMFVACGDDGSDFSTRPSDGSSSSRAKSSSSLVNSSSSVTLATPCKTDSTDTCEYGELVDDRDGQIYKTVKIGDQVWMAENLNYAYLQPTDELDSSSFCYNDSAEYCEKYGRLYLWSAAMDSAGTWSLNGKGCGYENECSPTYPVRGVCPEGWHLPSRTEWSILLTAVGGQLTMRGYSTAGTKLKSTSGWKDFIGTNSNGTDDFGFSALPAGFWFDHYCEEGRYAYFWSSTDINSGNVCYMILYDYVDEASLGNFRKDLLHSVRCIKN